MSLNWYPGHMTKARRMIAEAMPKQDVVIEVLDARMPRASGNPVLSELRGQKPCVKVLSKSDLADPETTKAWIRHFETARELGPVLAIAISQKNTADIRQRIPDACKKLALHPKGPGKTVRAMVVGIPNVGKSTLINTLMNREVAKTGDIPAVTKSVQRVTLANGMTLSDNPGILWPKIEDADASVRLAFGGAMPDNAIEYEVVALFGLRFFLAQHPERLLERYKFRELPAHADDALDEIGRRRGCLRSGGIVDRHKASDMFIHDFRCGALGRVSLEVPPPHRGISLDDGEQ
jgi:ribosome biogenesis GTPase A